LPFFEGSLWAESRLRGPEAGTQSPVWSMVPSRDRGFQGQELATLPAGGEVDSPGGFGKAGGEVSQLYACQKGTVYTVPRSSRSEVGCQCSCCGGGAHPTHLSTCEVWGRPFTGHRRQWRSRLSAHWRNCWVTTRCRSSTARCRSARTPALSRRWARRNRRCRLFHDSRGRPRHTRD
jgi:hypothetical protein